MLYFLANRQLIIQRNSLKMAYLAGFFVTLGLPLCLIVYKMCSNRVTLLLQKQCSMYSTTQHSR